MPITKAVQYNIWTTIYYSITGVIGLSLTYDIYVFWSVLSSTGMGLATANLS